MSKIQRQPTLVSIMKMPVDRLDRKDRAPGLAYGPGPPTDVPQGITQYWDTTGKAMYVWDSDNAAWNAVGAKAALFDHTIFTADVPFTATTEATAVNVITGGSLTYDGNTSVLVEFFTPRLESAATSGQSYILVLVRDTTVVVGKWASILMTNAITVEVHLSYRDVLVPAGAHTYSVKVYSGSANGGSVRAGGGGSNVLSPGFIRVKSD